ncbi:MAG: thioredoxin domain-containing protein [Candidatus Methanomethylicaceae archaeon]
MSQINLLLLPIGLLVIIVTSLLLVAFLMHGGRVNPKKLALAATLVLLLITTNAHFGLSKPATDTAATRRGREFSAEELGRLVQQIPTQGYALTTLQEDIRPYQRVLYSKARDELRPPLEVTIFSDPLCLFCHLLYEETLPLLASSYEGGIWVTHRHYVKLNSFAGGISVMTECAGKLRGAAAYHEIAKEAYLKARFSLEEIVKDIARKLDVDEETLMRCMINEETRGNVATDVGIGRRLQIYALPTWFVNDRRFDGYVYPKTVQSLIEELNRSADKTSS